MVKRSNHGASKRLVQHMVAILLNRTMANVADKNMFVNWLRNEKAYRDVLCLVSQQHKFDSELKKKQYRR